MQPMVRNILWVPLCRTNDKYCCSASAPAQTPDYREEAGEGTEQDREDDKGASPIF